MFQILFPCFKNLASQSLLEPIFAPKFRTFLSRNLLNQFNPQNQCIQFTTAIVFTFVDLFENVYQFIIVMTAKMCTKTCPIYFGGSRARLLSGLYKKKLFIFVRKRPKFSQQREHIYIKLCTVFRSR